MKPLAAAGGPEALQPVEAMLAVASHPANAIAEMSYTFWYRLSRSLTSSFGAERAPSLQARAHLLLLSPAVRMHACEATALPVCSEGQCRISTLYPDDGRAALLAA